MGVKKTKSSDIALKVEGVSKSFRLPTEKANGIKQAFINRMRGVKGYTKQQVLKDISFEVKKGDFFGIVGRNGSGKSTLLKLISQIYTPDSGKITVNGSLVPFIELGVGFNPELTGRENVYLNGAMLGFSEEEIDVMYDEIVDFAELHDFMDQKLKNYSSGMQVRLAFSVAIKAQGDILVLDEVLAVGDEAFQRKCESFFEQIKTDKTKTVILVTHDMESVRRYCSRAMMIDKGSLAIVGNSSDVANEYSLENLNTSSSRQEETQQGSFIEEFTVELLSGKNISQNEKVAVRYRIIPVKDMTVSVVMDLSNVDDNFYLYCSGSPYRKIGAGKSNEFEVELDIKQLNNMSITVHSSIRDEDGSLLAFSNEANSPSFIIRRDDYADKNLQSGVIFKDSKNVIWR